MLHTPKRMKIRSLVSMRSASRIRMPRRRKIFRRSTIPRRITRHNVPIAEATAADKAMAVTIAGAGGGAAGEGATGEAAPRS